MSDFSAIPHGTVMLVNEASIPNEYGLIPKEGGGLYLPAPTTGEYLPGHINLGDVRGNADGDCIINDQPGQTLPEFKMHYVFAKRKPNGDVYLNLRPKRPPPWRPPFQTETPGGVGHAPHPIFGFKVFEDLNTPEILVGQMIRYNGTIQGNERTELVLSAYQPGIVTLSCHVGGPAVAGNNQWHEPDPSARLGFLAWADYAPTNVKCKFSLHNPLAHSSLKAAIFNYDVMMNNYGEEGVTADRAVGVEVSAPFGGFDDGFYLLSAHIQSDQATIRSGAVYSSLFEATVQF